MKNTRKILVGAIAAAALAASSALVYAQPAGPGPGAIGEHGAARGDRGYGPGAEHGGHGMKHHGPGSGRGGPGGRWSNPAAAVEGHLAALKVELKITTDQDTAWKIFTDKARQQATIMIARREARRAQMTSAAPATPPSAPERLAQRTEFAKQGLASLEVMSAAVRDLYAVLTPEQKALADQQLARGPMGGGGRGMGGGRGFRR